MKRLLVMLLGLSIVLGACNGGTEDLSENTDAVTEEEAEATENKSDTEEEEGRLEGGTISPEELIENSCAECHAGDFALNEGAYDMSLEEMEDIILNGIGTMPAIDVNDDEATAIAEYLIDR